MTGRLIPFPRRHGHGQTRLSININAQTEEALREYARRHGVSVTETIRRMVPVAAHVLDAIDGGAEIRYYRGHKGERVVFTQLEDGEVQR